jgi:hypothetical protein
MKVRTRQLQTRSKNRSNTSTPRNLSSLYNRGVGDLHFYESDSHITIIIRVELFQTVTAAATAGTFLSTTTITNATTIRAWNDGTIVIVWGWYEF